MLQWGVITLWIQNPWSLQNLHTQWETSTFHTLKNVIFTSFEQQSLIIKCKSHMPRKETSKRYQLHLDTLLFISSTIQQQKFNYKLESIIWKVEPKQSQQEKPLNPVLPTKQHYPRKKINNLLFICNSWLDLIWPSFQKYGLLKDGAVPRKTKCSGLFDEYRAKL